MLVENFVPGTFEKWGLGWDVLSAENPRLVWARVSGWGQDGPYRDRPGFGTMIEAMSGFAATTGPADGPPTLPSFPMADMVAALAGTSAVLAALRHRDLVSGRGQVIDISLYEPLLAVLGPDAEPGSETFDLFLKDVLRDMTQKAGQKCTAIRRVLVPLGLADRVRDDLAGRLARVTVGDPAQESVRMGPVATAGQLADVRAGIDLLARDGLQLRKLYLDVSRKEQEKRLEERRRQPAQAERDQGRELPQPVEPGVEEEDDERRQHCHRGAEVAGSELVGLMPAGAAVAAAGSLLRIEGFDASRVLELHLLDD